LKADRVPFSLKFAYGIGQLPSGLHGYAVGIFLLFYYNQVLGLSAGIAGLTIGVATVVDSVTDPLVGSISDRWRSPNGRRHPFIFISILPVALSFYLLFNPLVTSEVGLCIWLVVFSNVFHTAVSLYVVPHLALGAEISEDYDERSALVAYRHFFTYVGGLLVFGLGFGVFFVETAEFQNGQLNAAAYPPFALLLSILIAGSLFWTAWGTRSTIPSLLVPPEGPTITPVDSLVRALRDMLGVLRIRNFPWFFSGLLTLYITVGVTGALDLYVLTFFWDLGPADVFWVLLAYPIGVLIGSPLAPAIIGRWGKKMAIVGGCLAWAFWQMLPVSLRLLDLFPENGHALLLPLLISIKFVQGACTTQGDVAGGAIIPDLADEQELDTGIRQEGVIVAAFSFSGKATAGLGSIFAGLALEAIDWPVGENIQSAADIPSATLASLGWVCGPLVAFLALGSIWFFLRLNLSRERFDAVRKELEERRGNPLVDDA